MLFGEMGRMNAMNERQYREWVESVSQRMWDALWAEFDGDIEIDTVMLGEICHTACNAFKVEFEEDN